MVQIQPFSLNLLNKNKILKKIINFINLIFKPQRYLKIKNISKKYFNNPLIKLFLHKNNDFIKFSLKKNYKIKNFFFTTSRDFILTHNYSFYNKFNNFLEKKFINIKYFNFIELLKKKNNKIKFIRLFKFLNFNEIKKIRLKIIQNFIYIYNIFFYSTLLDLFSLMKFLKKKKRLIFFLILSFKKNKLFVNLKNLNKKNYLSISSGLFIKFFEKRKALKKNKNIKLLIAKYIRKILIISKIKNIILIIKKLPVFINEIINFFNLPIAHKFINPIDNKLVEEDSNNFTWIKFLYFIFLENKNFSKNKNPQKGRIKRKILRKLTFENKLID